MVKQSYVTIYRHHTAKLIYFLRAEGYPYKVIGEVIGIGVPGVRKILRNNLRK